MAEPTVLGYIKEQPERLKYVFENKDVVCETICRCIHKK